MADIVTPEMYTGPSQFVHLHNHTIYSTLDGCASPDQYASRCAQLGYPAMSATEHGHMGSVPDMYLAFKKAGVKYIAGCFLPDQPIYTTDGVKPFRMVKSSDQVLSHTAHYRQIKNIQTRSYAGEVIRIKSWGMEDQVATPEHPFLVREVTRTETKLGVWHEDITIGFRAAKDIFREKYWRTYNTKRSQDRSNKRRYRFYLCVPRLPSNDSHVDLMLSNLIYPPGMDVQEHVEKAWINSATYTKSGYKTTTPVNLPTSLSMDDDLLWIMGLWLAEGSYTDAGLQFSLCADEYHFYERIADYFAQFDIKTTARLRNGDGESKKRDALDVCVYSAFIGRLFFNLFGEHFDKKTIPNTWLYCLNLSQTKALIDGVFDGDAKCGQKQSYLKLSNETLVWQVRLLMSKLEVPQTSAVTQLPGDETRQISYTIRRRESGHFYYDYDHKYIYLPVYSTEREYYKGTVYNIEVEHDNSYYTGVAVHNCEIYYNDWEPIRHDLEASGTKVRSPIWRKENPELAGRITRNRHLTVLCKNEVGFHNLVKLTTQAYGTGLFGVGKRQFNRIWFEKLCEHKEGLIILSGCLNGPVAHELRNKTVRDREGNLLKEYSMKECVDAAAKYVKKFKKAFGDDYYIELQMPGILDSEGTHDREVFQRLVELAHHYKLKTVLANDCHYLHRRDFQIQKIMMAIAQETTVDSPDLFHVNSDEQFMKTRQEMWAQYKNVGYDVGLGDDVFETACDNSLVIADKCIPLSIDPDPKFPTIDAAEDRLRLLTIKRLCELGLDKDPKRTIIDGKAVTYFEQAKIELKRFIDKGFASYFLITRDLMMYGKGRGWPFSPRGSAGGSLVCFLLGLHSLDPLKWGLSFDRFLSPSRGGYMLNVNMPSDD